MKQRRRAARAALAVGVALSSGIAIAPLSAQDAQPSATLLPGKGSALTMAKCAICHDITHVTRSRLTRDEWDDNIKVMIARGMPIEAHEIPVILDYLSTYYNRDKPPPTTDVAEASVPAATPGTAAPVERVLAANGCTACHALDTKIVGPSFREIAARYKADAGAPARLAAKVKEGGSGAWGPVPMPPHPQISEAEALRLATWVLRQ